MNDQPATSTVAFSGSIVMIALVFLCLAIFPSPVFSQSEDSSSNQMTDSATGSPAAIAPAAPSSVTATDTPNDAGGSIVVSWEISADDNGAGLVSGYFVYRSDSAGGSFEEIGDAVQGATSITDNKTSDGREYFYKVAAYITQIGENGDKTKLATESSVFGPVSSDAQWFNMNRLWCLIWVLLVSGAIMFYIRKAKSGGEIYIRKIAGIDAVDEAVGRATEMGKKIFFIPGIQDMNDVQTIAGIAILGRVAQLAAQYETWLEVPVSKSLVMVTARETMKEAYAQVGRPDGFNDAQVHYLTDDQFGYAAAIDGMVVREKPATIFYMGAFFAESLILAETGNAAGAIQIAGTAMPSQLPFFVAACDYTLIGEELFAASAYLSREPRQLGSLKGQDMGKAIFIVAIIVGVIVETFTNWNLSQFFTVR